MFGTYKELQEQATAWESPTPSTSPPGFYKLSGACACQFFPAHKHTPPPPPLTGSHHSVPTGADSVLIELFFFLFVNLQSSIFIYICLGVSNPCLFIIVTRRRQFTIRRIYLFLYFPSFIDLSFSLRLDTNYDDYLLMKW